MAGPGGQEVGRVSVKVVPNTDRFAKELKAQLTRLEKQLKVEIPVELKAEDVKRELRKVKTEAERTKIKLQAEVDGDGARREAGRVRQFIQKTMRSILVPLEVDKKKSIARIKADIAIIRAAVRGYNIRIPIEFVGLTKWVGILSIISGLTLGLNHAIGLVGGALQSMAAGLAVIPALAVGAAAGIGALVLGFQGFGTALKAAGDPKAFAEALKDLTPAAQESAKALAEFKQPFKEIQKAVQETLFKGLAKDFRSLKVLIPPIKEGMIALAGGTRDMFSEWAKMASTKRSVESLDIILKNTSRGLKLSKTSAADFGQAMRDIAAVGSAFLPRLGMWVAKLAKDFSGFIDRARRSGELEKWINNGIEGLKTFGRILADIWVGFGNIREAMQAGMGETFGQMIERFTESFRKLTGSKEGQQFFKDLASVMREILDIGGQIFGELFETFSKVLKDALPFLKQFGQTLGTTIVVALQTITPLLQSMFKWLSENKEVMAPILVALAGIVTGFKLFVSAANGISKVRDGLKAIRGGFDALKTVVVGSNGAGGLWGFAKWTAKGIGSAAKTVATKIGDMILWIRLYGVETVKSAAKATVAWVTTTAKAMATAVANVVRATATMIASFVATAASAIRTGLTVVAQYVAMGVAAVANAARTAAAWVAAWVTMAVQSLIQAARMAAAWVIAMGPIGWVIAAIVALVALIILNWDTIRDTTVKVFTAIWEFIKSVGKWIGDLFRKVVTWIGEALSTVWDVITSPFRKAWNWVKDTWDGIKDFFGKIPGWIGSALSSIWDTITAPFVSAYNYIMDLFGKIADTVKGVISDIKYALGLQDRGFKDGGIVGGMSGGGSGNRAAPPPQGRMVAPLMAPMKAAVQDAFSTMSGTSSFAGPGVNRNMSVPEALSVMAGSMSAIKSMSRTPLFPPTQATPELAGVGAQVGQALSEWDIKMDGQRVAKMVRKNNTVATRRN